MKRIAKIVLIAATLAGTYALGFFHGNNGESVLKNVISTKRS